MRKVSDPFKRTGHKTWWIRWYEGSDKKHKSFQTLTEARMYRIALYQRLNSDVYTNIDLGLDQAITFFADHNKAQNQSFRHERESERKKLRRHRPLKRIGV